MLCNSNYLKKKSSEIENLFTKQVLGSFYIASLKTNPEWSRKEILQNQTLSFSVNGCLHCKPLFCSIYLCSRSSQISVLTELYQNYR